MKLRCLQLTLAAALVGSPALAAPELEAVAEGLAAERIVTGLEFPVALAALPDGALLITEKQGALRLVQDGVLVPEPVATFTPVTRNEAGLLAIALAPDFETSRIFYVTYTPEAFQDEIHVVRLELGEQTATILEDPWLTLPSRAATDRHYAANLHFGPRGELYVSLGELNSADDAQDPSTLPGSLLRYEADLTIPADNPWPGSPVFAYGLRNPFSLEVAGDGRIFVGDNGADVADEIDLIEPRNNYGWPLIEGHCDHFPKRESCQTPGLYTDPIFEFRQVISPTGLVAYDAPLMPELRGDLLVAGFHSNAVHRLRLGSANAPAEPVGRLLEFASVTGYYAGGIVDLEQAPDGALLVLLGGFDAGDVWRLAPSSMTLSAAGPARPKLRRTAEASCSLNGGAPEPRSLSSILPWALAGLWLARRRAQRLGFSLSTNAAGSPRSK